MITIHYSLERLLERAVEAFEKRQKAATLLDLTETINKTSDPNVRDAAYNARRSIAKELAGE